MRETSALNIINTFKKSSDKSASEDVELLIMHVLGIDRNILLRDNPILSKSSMIQLKQFIERREKGEPLAYITNEIGFWNLSLYVNSDVLIPRPETEIMVEVILNSFNSERRRVLDLGTGSGAIGLSLAKERPDWEIICSDLSFDALKVTLENKERNSLNVKLVNANWLSAYKKNYFDLIISNPPYVDPSNKRILSNSLEFEPEIALFSESKGLSDIKKIVQESSKILVNKGYLFIEHGFDQSDEVSSLFEHYQFSKIKKHRDMQDINRVCSGRLNRC